MGTIKKNVRTVAWPVKQVRRLVRTLTQPLRTRRERRSRRR